MQQQRVPAFAAAAPPDLLLYAEAQADQQLQRWTRQLQLPPRDPYPVPHLARSPRVAGMHERSYYSPPNEDYFNPHQMQASRGEHHVHFENVQRRQPWEEMMMDGRAMGGNMMTGPWYGDGGQFRHRGRTHVFRDRRR